MHKCDIWWFWQKKHLQEQPVKKMVPDPRVPENDGSSPKCGPMEATCGRRCLPYRLRAFWFGSVAGNLLAGRQ